MEVMTSRVVKLSVFSWFVEIEKKLEVQEGEIKMLEAKLAEKEAFLVEKDARIAELEKRAQVPFFIILPFFWLLYRKLKKERRSEMQRKLSETRWTKVSPLAFKIPMGNSLFCLLFARFSFSCFFVCFVFIWCFLMAEIWKLSLLPLRRPLQSSFWKISTERRTEKHTLLRLFLRDYSSKYKSAFYSDVQARHTDT